MLKETMLKEAMNKLKDREINQEAWVKGMTEEEASLVPKKKVFTVEEFAQTTEGHTLSILYRNGEQRGYCVLENDGKKDYPILKTDQSIEFDIPDQPTDGLVCYDLNQFKVYERRSVKL